MNRQIVNRRYRLERKIGEGGTSEVYLGFDIVLNRRVAIKTLRTQFAANRAFRIRFEREAQAAAGFAHANIISIFDVGEDNGFPYIVMEYIEGQTLKEIIEGEGPFHPDDVAILVEQVAAALDFAHERGLVHRDVKPQNILIDRQGLAKVVDFGIAKSLSDVGLTETGSSLGTVHYISPEQASGLMATPESDIYALGVIAFEMLTGELPFDADTAIGVAMRHVNDEPPDPSQINPDVPPEAADVVLRALSKSPTRRYPTAGAFAAAMSNWRKTVAQPRTAPRFPTPLPVRPDATTRRIDAAAPPYAVVAQPADSHDDENTKTPFATQRLEKPLTSATNDLDGDSGGRNLSWIAAVIVVAVIAGVFWYGFGRSNGTGDPTVRPSATRAVIGATDDPTETPKRNPTRTPTNEPEPTIEPTDQPAEPTDPPVQAIQVPSVLDQDRDAARAAIEDVGLVFVDGGDISSETVAKGLAISQDPQPDAELDQGDDVTVTFSSGPETVDLTAFDAVGRQSDEVAAELNGAGLNVVLAEEGSESISEDSVIRLEPADVARPGDEVTVFVSVGDKVQIPVDLQGEPLDDVRDALTGLGFSIANEVAVGRDTLVSSGIDDPEGAGLVDNDVVGVQDNDAVFGGWVARGASITLIYYDADLTEPPIVPVE